MTDTFWIVVGLVIMAFCGFIGGRSLIDLRIKERKEREYFMRADFGEKPPSWR